MKNLSYQLWFAVRYVHVASVTLLAGGAFMVCALCASPRTARDLRRLSPAVGMVCTSLSFFCRLIFLTITEQRPVPLLTIVLLGPSSAA
jgi:hypothetical protein